MINEVKILGTLLGSNVIIYNDSNLSIQLNSQLSILETVDVQHIVFQSNNEIVDYLLSIEEEENDFSILDLKSTYYNIFIYTTLTFSNAVSINFEKLSQPLE